MFDGFGDLKASVQCVHPEERVFAHCGNFEGFGNNGILESRVDYIH